MAFGLRPYKFASGGYNSGGVTEYPIADGETDDMYTGCLMLQEASGYVTALAVTPTSTGGAATTLTIGVSVGYRYIDHNGVPTWSQRYVGHADNTEAFALVVDDPNAQFLIASDGATVQADMGLNAPLTSATGTATDISQGYANSGLSSIVLDQSAQAVTATLAVRLVSIPKDGTNETSTTPNVVVEFVRSAHQRSAVLGL